jgi:methionine-rich copper-binding protein CopC
MHPAGRGEHMHGHRDGLFLPLPGELRSKERGRGTSLKQYLALSFILGVALAGLAHGHAKITSTVPADGDFVASPETFVLNFDNEVTLTGVELHSVAGVSAEGRTIEGDVVDLDFAATEASRSFVIEISESLVPGEYFLVWRCIAADSHFATGEFFFTVISD